ncbi:iron complex transport system permease protein, partial [termite gut metagenome]
MQIRFLLLLVLFILAFIADIVLGSVHLSLRE